MDLQHLRASDGTGEAVLAHVDATRTIGSTVLSLDNVDNWNSDVIVVTGTPAANGFVSPTGMTIMYGHLNAGDFIIDGYAAGYVDNGNTTAEVAIVKMTTSWADTLVNLLANIMNDDGTPKDTSKNPVGAVIDFAGIVPPTGWLLMAGQAVSRATYAALFAILNPTIGTFTITIAAPGVVTLNAHGLVTGDPIYFTTTGALPTGLAINTVYYAIRIDANTIRLATTYANAVAGTAINTTGSQSGVHTMRRSPYGIGDGTTTFTLPDARGRIIAGNDQMNGTSANRLTNPASTINGLDGDILGNGGGAETHQLTVAQLAPHQHLVNTRAGAGGFGSNEVARSNATGTPDNIALMNAAGGDTAHNNVQPTLIMNKIIKT